MTEQAKLKTCPFCGGEGVVRKADEGFYAECIADACRVQVGFCNGRDECFGDFDTVEDAAAAWNQRNDAITPWRPISEYSPEMGEVVVGWAGSDMASTEAFCVGGVWYYDCEATSSHEPWDNQPTHFIKLTPPAL